MTIEQRIARLRESLHRRKRNRERKRRLHQGHKAHREAYHVRKLRKRIKRLVLLLSAPRTMFDAVTVGNIPDGAKAVAGYVDGIYNTFHAVVAAFPSARHISIAVFATEDAHVLDIEAGNATNADAPGWFKRHDKKRYGKAIFYTSAGNVAALIATLAAAGIARHEYIIWSAHYTEQRHVCSPNACGYPEAEATQFTTHGETVDESKLTVRFWDR